MATIFRKLSTKADKATGKHEILIRFKQGNQIDQRAKTNIFISPKYWLYKEVEVDVKDKKGNIVKGENEDIKKKKEVTAEMRISDRIQTADTIYHAAAETKLKELESYLSNAFIAADKSAFPAGWVQEQIDRYNFPERFVEAQPEEQKQDTLFIYIYKFIETAPQRKDKDTGRLLSPNNIQQYRATYKHLQAFAKLRRKSDFEFSDITTKFYDKFVSYLQGLEFTANSVGKHIRILKLMLNEAPKELKAQANYDKFHVFTEDIDTVYLNEEELHQLKDADFNDTLYLDRTRDWFLLLAWTGCRFSDLEKIGKTDIKDGFISFRQQKTNTKVTIPLHPIVVEILSKYDYKMPEPISNQRFNEYIKTACERAGITTQESSTRTIGGQRVTTMHPKYELISSHTGRRSFATNMYKQGLPSLMIMSITGHKTEKSFLKYIRVTQSEHAEMMAKAWQDKYNKVKKGEVK